MKTLPPPVPPGARFAFGESPFRVKGVLYLGTQTYFERNVRGGLQALLDVIEEAELRDFIGQHFLPSSRYDVMPVPALIVHEALAVGKSLEDYLDERTTWQATQDIHGVYRFLLKLASPELVVKRMPQVLVQMFEFPTAEMEMQGERDALVTFHRIPVPLEQWLRIGFSVYGRTALTLAGAKNVALDFDRSSDEGTEAGLRMRTLRMNIRW